MGQVDCPPADRIIDFFAVRYLPAVCNTCRSPCNVVVGLSGLSTAGARRGEMEGRYWICTMHAHRHDPVRATSSRDPCLDHPGLKR